ncbi:hypothetical protein TNCV_1649561 [Trichonephila clavipes]|nr:hypothetical protein TNCV_1649561 [Trichonephila clavipes]
MILGGIASFPVPPRRPLTGSMRMWSGNLTGQSIQISSISKRLIDPDGSSYVISRCHPLNKIRGYGENILERTAGLIPGLKSEKRPLQRA